MCGTDVELFTGEMAYLHSGEAAYPLRIGHEWCGTVSAIGAGVDAAWLGRRVTGDTMLGCGRCDRCRAAGSTSARTASRSASATAGRARWPSGWRCPHRRSTRLPDSGGRHRRGAGRARRQRAGAPWRRRTSSRGERLLVVGAGHDRAPRRAGRGAPGRSRSTSSRGREPAAGFARSLGFSHVWPPDGIPSIAWDAVVDASNSAGRPRAGGRPRRARRRVVWIGLAGEPSLVDSRRVTLKDVTVVGILSGSPGLAGAIDPLRVGSRSIPRRSSPVSSASATSRACSRATATPDGGMPRRSTWTPRADAERCASAPGCRDRLAPDTLDHA